MTVPHVPSSAQTNYRFHSAHPWTAAQKPWSVTSSTLMDLWSSEATALALIRSFTTSSSVLVSPTSLMPNRSLTRSDAIAHRAYLPRMKRRLRSKFFCITKWHKRLSSPVSCFSFVNKPRPREERRPLVDQISRLSHSKKRDRFCGETEELGVRYRNAMPDSADLASGQGRSWRDTLNVTDRKQAEQRLTELGYNFRWLDDGGISVQTPPLLAVDEFGRGKDVFFNQIVAAAAGWTNDESDEEPRLCYGDYSRIDQNDLEAAIAASYEHTVDLGWQTGDIALLDNLKVMHGRRPFSGSRSILASLCTPISRPSLVS